MLVGAQLLIGTLFGATQTGTTVLATDVGQPGLAGLVHAMLGLGSALAGIATAFIPERIGPERRILVAAVALLVLSVPLLFVDGLPALIAVVAVLGCAVAPFMIGVFTLAERVVTPGRVATAMTVLASATGLGYAVGSTIAGRLADEHGYTAAFAVTVSAMVCALALVVAVAAAAPGRTGAVRRGARAGPRLGSDLRHREGDRADDLGAVAELAGDHPHRGRGVGLGVAVDGGPDARRRATAEVPSEPPSTIASGLRLLHRSASARPTERPASLSTRRTPASPSASSSRTLSTDSSSSYAGCSSAISRGAETRVSRQPRLPQRQTWPSSPTWTWPISPAMPVAPRCSRPPSTMPAPRPLATLT